jgi:AcrR family transcriptional regulator
MVDATVARILRAAAHEFVERGFNGVTMSQIAKRARLSRQLVHHHFPSKAGLLKAVNERLYRPVTPWQIEIPEDLADIIADRFKRRTMNLDYLRVLTWEAASVRTGLLPREKERSKRIAEYGDQIRSLQAEGRLPQDMDPRMIYLTIIALATYPLAFNLATRLITGRAGTEAEFQEEWTAHLRKLAELWLRPSAEGRARKAKQPPGKA